jgi:hypothetical protein
VDVGGRYYTSRRSATKQRIREYCSSVEDVLLMVVK